MKLDMTAASNLVEVAKAIGALATPVVVAIVAYLLQRRQKLAEATMAERVRHIGNISPLVNRIYSYRSRVGAFLDWKPEDILAAKREADKEFWTFKYLWSCRFIAAYDDFMDDSFETYRGEGERASIRAKSDYYPTKATTIGWKAFTDTDVDAKSLSCKYRQLQSIIARDLGL